MTTTMKTLAEMTTEELESLKDQVVQVISLSNWIADLVNFRNAIDDELDRRGA